MKKTIGTIILVLFFLLPGLSTATDVEGLIDTDTIWNVAGSPYIVTGNTLVASGVRLTIYPDVQVKFDGEYNLRIEGNIQAIGTPGNEILFTSNQTSPQMNDWSGLYLVNNDGSELSWIILEYSNTGIFVDAGTDNKVNNSIIRHARDGLQIAGPSIVNNMYIYDCLTGAHMFNTDSILFVDNTLENMSKGISIEGYANPTLNFNNFLEISDYSVYLPHNTDGVIDARYNYWGPATTIEMDTEGPDSNIEKIYDFYDNPTQGRVDYNNWLNAPISDSVIEVGPADLTASQGPDVQSTQLITIANSGGSLLNWNIVEDDTACDSPTDIPWLSVSPDSGTTVPLDSTDVYVIFDSTGLAPGDSTANLCVNSDDPVTPVVQVPVALTVESPVVEVEIDIIPRTCPNECPIKGGGSIEVAILGTMDFDVNDIDIASVRLEGVAPVRSRLKDKSTPVSNPVDECDCTTEGRDGFLDLCLKFNKKAILSALGEVNVGDSFVLTLTGSLNDGTPIEGQDCIVIVKKGKKD